jgi:predicted metal-dependent hydrolase
VSARPAGPGPGDASDAPRPGVDGGPDARARAGDAAPAPAGPLTPRARARLARHAPDKPRASCADAPPPALRLGAAQFNRREYFECHETLEAAWNDEPGPVRTLYKGILQVGVGCYHLLRGNYRGATIKLQSGAVYLEPFAPRCLGVDVARLIDDARRLRAAVVAAGPEGTDRVDRALLPRVVLDPPAPER